MYADQNTLAAMLFTHYTSKFNLDSSLDCRRMDVCALDRVHGPPIYNDSNFYDHVPQRNQDLVANLQFSEHNRKKCLNRGEVHLSQ
eukprot:Awhi_evm1s4059